MSISRTNTLYLKGDFITIKIPTPIIPTEQVLLGYFIHSNEILDNKNILIGEYAIKLESQNIDENNLVWYILKRIDSTSEIDNDFITFCNSQLEPYYLYFKFTKAVETISSQIITIEKVSIQIAAKQNEDGTYGDYTKYPYYTKSLFGNVNSLYSKVNLDWAYNVLDKLKGYGILPSYISKEEDFNIFWGWLCHWYSIIVNFSRQFLNVVNGKDNKLFEEFLKQKGYFKNSKASLYDSIISTQNGLFYPIQYDNYTYNNGDLVESNGKVITEKIKTILNSKYILEINQNIANSGDSYTIISSIKCYIFDLNENLLEEIVLNFNSGILKNELIITNSNVSYVRFSYTKSKNCLVNYYYYGENYFISEANTKEDLLNVYNTFNKRGSLRYTKELISNLLESTPLDNLVCQYIPKNNLGWILGKSSPGSKTLIEPIVIGNLQTKEKIAFFNGEYCTFENNRFLLNQLTSILLSKENINSCILSLSFYDENNEEIGDVLYENIPDEIDQTINLGDLTALGIIAYKLQPDDYLGEYSPDIDKFIVVKNTIGIGNYYQVEEELSYWSNLGNCFIPSIYEASLIYTNLGLTSKIWTREKYNNFQYVADNLGPFGATFVNQSENTYNKVIISIYTADEILSSRETISPYKLSKGNNILLENLNSKGNININLNLVRDILLLKHIEYSNSSIVTKYPFYILSEKDNKKVKYIKINSIYYNFDNLPLGLYQDENIVEEEAIFNFIKYFLVGININGRLSSDGLYLYSFNLILNSSEDSIFVFADSLGIEYTLVINLYLYRNKGLYYTEVEGLGKFLFNFPNTTLDISEFLNSNIIFTNYNTLVKFNSNELLFKLNLILNKLPYSLNFLNPITKYYFIYGENNSNYSDNKIQNILTQNILPYSNSNLYLNNSKLKIKEINLTIYSIILNPPLISGASNGKIYIAWYGGKEDYIIKLYSITNNSLYTLIGSPITTSNTNYTFQNLNGVYKIVLIDGEGNEVIKDKISILAPNPITWNIKIKRYPGLLSEIQALNISNKYNKVYISLKGGIAPYTVNYYISRSYTEKITNSADREFTSDTGFWNTTYLNNDEWIIGGGVASITSSINSIYRLSLLTVNKFYKVTFEVLTLSSGGNLRVELGQTLGSIITTTGIYTEVIKCIGSDTFMINTNNISTTASIDHISIKEISLVSKEVFISNKEEFILLDGFMNLINENPVEFEGKSIKIKDSTGLVEYTTSVLDNKLFINLSEIGEGTCLI